MFNMKCYLIILVCIGISICQAQESVNASGGDASGSGGTVAYSIGQLSYAAETGSTGNLNQGVQQPFEIFVVGIDKGFEKILLTAFPNPTVDYLTLEVGEYENAKLKYQLVDVTGKLMVEEQINRAQTKIDLTQYSEGVFFLSIRNESKKIKTFKIIKNQAQ